MKKDRVFYCDECHKQLTENQAIVTGFGDMFDGPNGVPVDKIVHLSIICHECYQCDKYGNIYSRIHNAVETLTSLLYMSDVDTYKQLDRSFLVIMRRLLDQTFEEVWYKMNHCFDTDYQNLVKSIYGDILNATTEYIKEINKIKFNKKNEVVRDFLYGVYDEGIGVDYAGIDIIDGAIDKSKWPTYSSYYFIEWDRNNTIVELCDWMRQLSGKTWVTIQQLSKFCQLTTEYISRCHKTHYKKNKKAFDELCQYSNMIALDTENKILKRITKEYDIPLEWWW